MHLLTTEGWKSNTTIEGIINQVRATLLSNGARVDLHARKVLSIQALRYLTRFTGVHRRRGQGCSQ